MIALYRPQLLFAAAILGDGRRRWFRHGPSVKVANKNLSRVGCVFSAKMRWYVVACGCYSAMVLFDLFCEKVANKYWDAGSGIVVLYLDSLPAVGVPNLPGANSKIIYT